MNFRFLAGDVIAKAITRVVLALWVNFCRNGEFSWAITSFSLSSLNNTLVVGVPLLRAMYGAVGADLVVQSSVIQLLLWFPILLFMLEFWRTSRDAYDRQLQLCSFEKGNGNPSAAADGRISLLPRSSNFGATMKKVGAELGKNPNCYACALGLVWALLAKRWDFEMPTIVTGSILIMAKAGSGVAMFTMGLQEKVIACGVRLTIYGMVLRFVGGPLTTAVGSLALGLQSNILHIVIIQAALPQPIASFVFAQEYGLHADVLSTAVIFGTIVSLPLLVAGYAIWIFSINDLMETSEGFPKLTCTNVDTFRLD